MPLSKLFRKRHSLKDDKLLSSGQVSSVANQSISSASNDHTGEQESSRSETDELAKLVNKDCVKESLQSTQRNPSEFQENLVKCDDLLKESRNSKELCEDFGEGKNVVSCDETLKEVGHKLADYAIPDTSKVSQDRSLSNVSTHDQIVKEVGHEMCDYVIPHPKAVFRESSISSEGSTTENPTSYMAADVEKKAKSPVRSEGTTTELPTSTTVEDGKRRSRSSSLREASMEYSTSTMAADVRMKVKSSVILEGSTMEYPTSTIVAGVKNKVRSSEGQTVADVKKKPRSLSLREVSTSKSSKSRRRKSESTRDALNSTDDEGFEGKVIQVREKDLEKVIGKFVDKIVRKSIVTAVMNVNVDNLCEEVLRTVSNRTQSDSSECPITIEQKLRTDSVMEFEDFERAVADGKVPGESELESVINRSDGVRTEKEIKGNLMCRDTCLSLQQPSLNDGGESAISMPQSVTTSIEAVDSTLQYNEELLVNRNDHLLDKKEAINVNIYDEGASGLKKETIEESELDEEEYIDDIEYVKNRYVSGLCTEDDESASCHSLGSLESGADSKLENSSSVEDYSSSKIMVDCEESASCLSFASIESGTDIKLEKTASVEDSSCSKGNVDCEESATCHSVGSLEIVTDGQLEKTAGVGDYSSTKDNIDCDDIFLLEDSVDRKRQKSLLVEHGVISKEIIDCDDRSLTLEELVTEKYVTQSEEIDAIQTEETTEPEDLITMSAEDVSLFLRRMSEVSEKRDSIKETEDILRDKKATEEDVKINWKVGYLHVKHPNKKGKSHLKAWKKRCVAVHPDEFVNDPKDPYLMISVYSGESGAARKHSASYWKSVSSKGAVVYRSHSRTHRYAFTVASDGKAIIHLASDSESASQEWMAAIRAILWPPSPVVQLEKMLNGSQFEISIIDNEFSYHAGLLGMYGYLTISQKKLTLIHPQQGYVIQEWYLNTVDKFEVMQQSRIEDVHKVISMTTCSDSSTGKGDILLYCQDAVSMLQAIASTIHQLLTLHSIQEGGRYQKQLQEVAQWLLPDVAPQEEHYQVPPKQVKSLLDIPNFIFEKPLSPGTPTALSTSNPIDNTPKLNLESVKTNSTVASLDTGVLSDDILNCSAASFVFGGGSLRRKSSDSEFSDVCTPPLSPALVPKNAKGQATTSKKT